jgi:hypothetical protein
VGETRVDLLHLLEDLRDAYVASLEDTILTEAVANALDSGATRVRFVTDPAGSSLTLVDDGAGMRRRDLRRYHDLATSTKRRGEGIGFAGVGIKLGLLVSMEVVTESRAGASHVATSWRLASRHRAPWKWMPPSGRVTDHGTAVSFTLQNPLSPLLDAGFIEATLRHHFRPLLDPRFAGHLERYYPQGVAFEIDGKPIEHEHSHGVTDAPLAIRMARRRKPSAVGYLVRHEAPLPDEARGLAVSTLGKVIKQGWDWLGLSPALGDLVSGLIEAPDLAACLTLNKSDFIRTGARGATYLAYRKAIQEAVTDRLAAWGDTSDSSPDVRPKTQRLERDLERVLDGLADDFPLLRSLAERRRGGQKSLPLPNHAGESHAVAVAAVEEARPAEPVAPAPPAPEPGSATEPPSAEVPPDEPVHEPTNGDARLTDRLRRRRGRLGLSVAFESRPDDPELGRLIESTVWINDAHPAFVRALASRSMGYHMSVAVALALAPLGAGAEDEHAFVTSFLARWGEALNVPGARAPGLRRRKR